MELIIDEVNLSNENDLKTMENNNGLSDSKENQGPSEKAEYVEKLCNNEFVNKLEKKDECIELKNIKYKTMLTKGVALKETSSSNDLSNLEKFLDTEKTNNKNEQWCKLDKTRKTQKLMAFVETYQKANNLDQEETQILIQFFKECLDKKKLARVKDVVYDKITGEIKEIPALLHTKKHFTLKNLDKHVSTMKSLTPKKPVKVNTKTSKVRGLTKDETNEESKEE
jgi:hypothetical protein